MGFSGDWGVEVCSVTALRRLLRDLGFAERQRGSHHIFRRDGVPERLVLQRDGSHAKPYQVRQVRKVILNYQLGERE